MLVGAYKHVIEILTGANMNWTIKPRCEVSHTYLLPHINVECCCLHEKYIVYKIIMSRNIFLCNLLRGMLLYTCMFTIALTLV